MSEHDEWQRLIETKKIAEYWIERCSRAEKQLEQRNWVSVKDRLPPVHFDVLVWCGKDKYHCDQYHIARIDKHGCWYNVDRFGGCNPIFWCPLPESPESE